MIIVIIVYSLRVFHIRSLCDSKSSEIFGTLLTILIYLSNALVWMVSTRPFISKSTSLFINLSIIVPRAPITIGIIVTFMFHIFSTLLEGPSIFPSFHFFQFYSVVSQDINVHNVASSLFLLLLLYGLVVWLRLGDPFVCQNPRRICLSHFPGEILGCANTFCSYGQITIIR